MDNMTNSMDRNMQSTVQPNMQTMPQSNMQATPQTNQRSTMQQSQSMTPPTDMNENAALVNEINSSTYNGTMQRILQNNIGEYVVIDFLIGSNNIVYREGILYSVGLSYVVLYDEKNEQYTICDLYAIKFVTYVNPQRRTSRPVISRNIRR